MIEDICAPLFIAVNNDFSVGPRSEGVSPLFELRAQLLKVVNLAVQNDPNFLVRVGHRLMSARQVYDR